MLPGDGIYEQIDRIFEKERRLMREGGEQVHLLIPLDLDGYMFTDDWKSGKKQKVRSRIAADLTGWQNDEDKVKRGIDLIIRALRADEGGREPPPPSRL
jgi:hypothetical protein